MFTCCCGLSKNLQYLLFYQHGYLEILSNNATQQYDSPEKKNQICRSAYLSSLNVPSDKNQICFRTYLQQKINQVVKLLS